jgi:hypothetical protein
MFNQPTINSSFQLGLSLIVHGKLLGVGIKDIPTRQPLP